MKITALSLLGLFAITAVLARDDPFIFGHDLELNLGENLNFNRVSDAENNSNDDGVPDGTSGILSDNEKSGTGLNIEHSKGYHKGNNTSIRHELENRVLHDYSKHEFPRGNYHQHRHGENGNTNGSTSKSTAQIGL